MPKLGLQVHPGGGISISSSGSFLLAVEGEDCCCAPGTQLYRPLVDCCTGETWYVLEAAVAAFDAAGCRVLLMGGRCYTLVRTRGIPRRLIPQGSVVLDSLPGATCSPDDCGRGVCALPCPNPCCVQQFLPRCDSNPWIECCKLGRTAEVTYTYTRVRQVMSRAAFSVPMSMCPTAIECQGNPGTGILLGPERSHTETETYTLRVRFECVHNSAMCLSFNYNRTRHGFAVGTVSLVDCVVIDVPQVFDEEHPVEGCGGAQVPFIGVPIPTYRFIDASQTPRCRVDESRDDFDPGTPPQLRAHHEIHGDVVQACFSGRMRLSRVSDYFLCGVTTGRIDEQEAWTYQVGGGDPCPPGAGDCGALLMGGGGGGGGGGGARPGDVGRISGTVAVSSGAGLVSPLAGDVPRRLKARDFA